MNNSHPFLAKHSNPIMVPWGSEDTGRDIWIGPMRADGIKIKDIVAHLPLQDLKEEIVATKRQQAALLSSAPQLLDSLVWALDMIQLLAPKNSADMENYGTFMDKLAEAERSIRKAVTPTAPHSHQS